MKLKYLIFLLLLPIFFYQQPQGKAAKMPDIKKYSLIENGAILNLTNFQEGFPITTSTPELDTSYKERLEFYKENKETLCPYILQRTANLIEWKKFCEK